MGAMPGGAVKRIDAAFLRARIREYSAREGRPVHDSEGVWLLACEIMGQAWNPQRAHRVAQLAGEAERMSAISAAETLYNLQSVPGIDRVVDFMRRDHLKDAMELLETGRVLSQRGARFAY